MREKEEFTPVPYMEIKQFLFTMKETQKEIRRQNNDKYLPFENAEMKQGKQFFFPFFVADKVALKHRQPF